MPKFTPEERDLLEKYVTSAENDVFAVRNLPGLTGAVYARYSRAPGGFRETLLKEFIREGQVDADRAQELIERVLIAFGDDSVGELEGAHVSFEGISMVATKELEDRRIGGSPIEQSTRYVVYDRRGEDGNWMYVRPPEIMESEHAEAYVATMDFIFDTYAELVEPMQEHYRKLKPIEEAEYDVDGDGRKERLADLTDERDIKSFRRTYKMDIRTKACDTLRYLLPLSTRTNVGMFGNGRFFQGLLAHCYTSGLPEANRIAERAHEALNDIMPRYVKRAANDEYRRNVRRRMADLTASLLSGIEPDTDGYVDLADRGESDLQGLLNGQADADALRRALQDEDDVMTLACMLYEHSDLSLRQLRSAVRGMDAETRNLVARTYVGDRRSRRNRPGRAFESGYRYTFDMLTDFGTYKDLMRHRMTTQMRQRFTPLLGFAMPEDLETAGFADRALECHRRAVELYERLHPDFPEQASYAALHGSKVRWLMGMNDRAAMHLIELRTTPQGHTSYRRVAQAMHRAIAERSTWRGEAIAFVDHGDYQWARGDSEARQRVKERKLEEASASRKETA